MEKRKGENRARPKRNTIVTFFFVVVCFFVVAAAAVVNIMIIIPPRCSTGVCDCLSKWELHLSAVAAAVGSRLWSLSLAAASLCSGGVRVCVRVCPDARAGFGLAWLALGGGRGSLVAWPRGLPLSYITFRVAGGYREDGRARLGSFCQAGDAGGGAGRRGRGLGRAVRGAAGLGQRPHAALSYGLVLEPVARRETKQQHRAPEKQPQSQPPAAPSPSPHPHAHKHTLSNQAASRCELPSPPTHPPRLPSLHRPAGSSWDPHPAVCKG